MMPGPDRRNCHTIIALRLGNEQEYRGSSARYCKYFSKTPSPSLPVLLSTARVHLQKTWLNRKMIQRLIPKIFYNQLSEGLDLFVDCLGFKILYRDENLAVVERDGAKTYVVESPEYAAKDRPEIALETDTIHELYAEIKARRPEMLHPNLNQIRRQPWGSWEFAVLDKTTVCVVFRQWNQ